MESDETWFWLFDWFEYTTLGIVIRESIWLFPVIEAVHLLALCMLGGAVLVVDIRMLGMGLKRQTIRELAEQLKPWLMGAVALILTTGVLLFVSEAVKCYYSQSFKVKMIALPIALAFTFTLRAKIAYAGGMDATLKTRLAAGASMLLWFTVAAAGRWIGFS
jgi:hypothetical protein